jgi:very-short-patch-repair endonuclease
MSLLSLQLRRNLTEPERLLWEKLRNRQLGGLVTTLSPALSP